MVQSREFSQEEFEVILKQGTALISRGYLTGINFIQSQEPLPTDIVIIHFLHNRKDHVDYVKSRLRLGSILVPRFTFFMLRQEYFDLPTFDEDYRNASFFDENLQSIDVEVAKAVRRRVTVADNEMDLVIPLDRPSLESTIDTVQQANANGPLPWLDPVIIIRSRVVLPALSGFVVPGAYVSIGRDSEEFYSRSPRLNTAFFGFSPSDENRVA